MKPTHHVAFRYESLRGDKRAWTLDTIRNHRFFFPSHDRFVDLDECQPEWDTETGREGDFFNGLVEDYKKHLNKDALDGDDIQALHQLAIGFQKEAIKRAGIKCFTGKVAGDEENTFMWENYADNHQGICLVLNVENRYFEKIKVVGYPAVKNPIILYPVTEEEKLSVFRMAFFQKGEAFQQEHEYRIVIPDGANEYHYFNMSLLEEVQFGWKTSKKDIDLVIGKLMKSEYPHVELFKMEPNPDGTNFIPKPYGTIMKSRAVFTIDASK
jgi:hypothetical protein